MDENLISADNRLLISFFFSLIFLMTLSNFTTNFIDNVIPKFDKISGTVYGYTTDSVYVDINWEINYNYNPRYTEYSEEEFEIFISDLMNKKVESLVGDIHYFEYVILEDNPIVTNKNGVKIKLFN